MILTAPAESTFSLDTIKGLMDGFDPAALLPDIQKIVHYTVFICRWSVMIAPVLLLAMGIGYLLLAPKEANHYFGYKTYFGMGSVEAWRFTQKLAGAILGGLGLALTIAMMVMAGGFSGLEPMDMVWRAFRCLLWQGGLALTANFAIHVVVFVRFNRKGDFRRKQA